MGSVTQPWEWILFRNRDDFKTAIYFHCGGLDLLPAT